MRSGRGRWGDSGGIFAVFFSLSLLLWFVVVVGGAMVEAVVAIVSVFIVAVGC